MKTPERPRPADLEPGEEEIFERLHPASTLLPEGGRACPGADRLRAAAEGVLPEDAAREVAQHLAECAPCRMLSEELAAWEGPELSPHERERLWRATKAKAGLIPGPARSPRGSRAWALPAVAAALAAAIPAWIVIQSTRPGPGDRPDGPRTPSPPVAAPALPLEKLPPRTPPAAAIVWRSNGDSFDRDLQQALVPYVAGDLREAAGRLGPLAARYPDAAAPGLYLGVAHLLLGEPAAALAALERVPREPNAFWTPHVEWYLAVASERSGDRERARRLARALCAGGGEYSARACAAAPALAGGSE